MASRKANPAVIGAFVLGAIALTVAAVLLFGSGRLFQKTTRWVIYFDSGLTGLDVGAPVIFRGVTVGSVVDIAAFVDPNRDLTASPVYIELVRGSVRVPEGVTQLPLQIIDNWIKEKGLRAQLKTQSLVTGKLYVDLGFHPGTPLDLKGLDPAVPEIPAVPTQLEEIEQTVKAFVERIRKLPLENIVEKIDSAVASADELLSDPKLKDAIANLDGTLVETRKLIARVNSGFDDFSGDLRGALEQATKTLANADAAVSDVRGFIEPGSPVYHEILVALDELSETLRSVRALSDALARDPNQIIFGRGEPGAQR
jgi:paraquat-inducible protein B